MVNSCDVHVLYKIIFSNEFNLFWTRTLFLKIVPKNIKTEIIPFPTFALPFRELVWLLK